VRLGGIRDCRQDIGRRARQKMGEGPDGAVRIFDSDTYCRGFYWGR